jgi:thiamine-phosphate pyrophosphorylase
MRRRASRRRARPHRLLCPRPRPTPAARARCAPQGLHYPERLRPRPPLPAVARLRQSTSLHSLQDLSQGWGALDYAFLSPVFDSISKQGHRAAAFDGDELRRLLRGCPVDVVALGGITPARVQEARGMGFKGVAAIGSVWGAADPVRAFLELQAACDGGA